MLGEEEVEEEEEAEENFDRQQHLLKTATYEISSFQYVGRRMPSRYSRIKLCSSTSRSVERRRWSTVGVSNGTCNWTGMLCTLMMRGSIALTNNLFDNN